MKSDYSRLRLTKENIDIYFPIQQKANLLRKVSAKYFNGFFLDLGCGRMPYKSIIEKESQIVEYIGMDIEHPFYEQNECRPDTFWDGSIIPLENNKVDSAMLVEVLEHTPNPTLILKELNRVMRTNGNLLITVPFLWTLHDIPYDEYRYTPFALQRMLEECGFELVEMESFGNWHASLASTLALYARRALRGKKQKLISTILFPIIKYLYKLDNKQSHNSFYEGQMISGIWCVAKKRI